MNDPELVTILDKVFDQYKDSPDFWLGMLSDKMSTLSQDTTLSADTIRSELSLFLALYKKRYSKA